MKPKTLKRIMRRFESLPLHFIDADILFEANHDTKLGNQCSNYLNKVGYKYRGIVPLSVIGEFFMIVFRDVQETEEKYLLFNFIDRLIKNRKIKFSALKYGSLDIVDKIKEVDSRIEDTDAVHLANCIQDKCNAFVTFDEKLIGNERLENEFNIRITHPKNL